MNSISKEFSQKKPSQTIQTGTLHPASLKDLSTTTGRIGMPDFRLLLSHPDMANHYLLDSKQPLKSASLTSVYSGHQQLKQPDVHALASNADSQDSPHGQLNRQLNGKTVLAAEQVNVLGNHQTQSKKNSEKVKQGSPKQEASNDGRYNDSSAQSNARSNASTDNAQSNVLSNARQGVNRISLPKNCPACYPLFRHAITEDIADFREQRLLRSSWKCWQTALIPLALNIVAEGWMRVRGLSASMVPTMVAIGMAAAIPPLGLWYVHLRLYRACLRQSKYSAVAYLMASCVQCLVFILLGTGLLLGGDGSSSSSNGNNNAVGATDEAASGIAGVIRAAQAGRPWLAVQCAVLSILFLGQACYQVKVSYQAVRHYWRHRRCPRLAATAHDLQQSRLVSLVRNASVETDLSVVVSEVRTNDQLMTKATNVSQSDTSQGILSNVNKSNCNGILSNVCQTNSKGILSNAIDIASPIQPGHQV